jgi:phosphoribosylaminoimidazolecarboxamide formyltransferase/IMP cyclohydrolase
MLRPIRRALVSVSEKSGVADFARALAARGIHLLSTGGTAALLEKSGVSVTEVAKYTGFPEIMDGRVKTLHPKIHGGLLGRRGVDEAVMSAHGIDPIDLLVVNLYPFAASVARAGTSFEDAIEQIDVGGPAMLRAAAKNHDGVAVVVDPGDYPVVLDELARNDGRLSAQLRLRLAAKAFRHTAEYDARVASYLERHTDGQRAAAASLPNILSLALPKRFDLRYGENPQQSGALYADPTLNEASIGRAEQLQGKELSFNNLADADSALECVRRFTEPACVIVKHANPCGVAVADSLLVAYEHAYRTDPTSAFGGIIAFNRRLDAATAAAIVERQFVEVIVAPTVAPEVQQALKGKDNLRLLVTGELGETQAQRVEYRSINGGLLAQTADLGYESAAEFRVVTKRSPTAAELRDLIFAWRVAHFVKSNAIVYAREGATIGIGAGQMSRVVSSRIAAMKAADAGLKVAGAVAASDAFFPFRDGVDVSAEQGIAAVIQPGGSKRDDEVIAAANEHGMAMIFTGVRHFRH